MIRSQSKKSTRIAILAQVALKVCDELAHAGRERSDIPRLWLEMLVRRHRGEASVGDLAATTRMFTPWRRQLDGESFSDRVWRQWWRVVGLIERIRRGLITEAQAELLPDMLPEVLVRLGEQPAAAVSRVQCWAETFERSAIQAESDDLGGEP